MVAFKPQQRIGVLPSLRDGADRRRGQAILGDRVADRNVERTAQRHEAAPAVAVLADDDAATVGFLAVLDVGEHPAVQAQGSLGARAGRHALGNAVRDAHDARIDRRHVGDRVGEVAQPSGEVDAPADLDAGEKLGDGRAVRLDRRGRAEVDAPAVHGQSPAWCVTTGSGTLPCVSVMSCLLSGEMTTNSLRA